MSTINRHVIEEMGQRFARCTCGHNVMLSSSEFAAMKRKDADDLLLDRHAGHVATMREQGRA